MRLRHIPGAEQMIEENPHVVHGAKEKKGTWQQIFGNDHPIRIEVGMGKGQFILEQASRNPDVNFVGIEKYSTVLLKAIRKREQMELSNIYFLCEDARELAEIFGPGEVERIYLNFSDPWPKDRHARRRLTSPPFMAVYDQILQKDGRVEFKTDNRPLFDFSLTQFTRTGYRLSEVTNDLHRERDNVIQTDYEARFVAEGVKINRCVATKEPTIPQPEGEPPKLSLLDYLPEEMDHIPYGMEEVFAQNQIRLVREREKRSCDGGERDA